MRNIRAAVLRQKGAPLKIESLELDGPLSNEVLIRIVASGICHTDIMFYDRWKDTDRPEVLGHEGAGVVTEVGKNIEILEVGDHVVLSYQSCGSCPKCVSGQPYECQHFPELNFGFKRLDGSNA